jgi:hypothetical protein
MKRRLSCATVTGDCPSFRGAIEITLRKRLARRENGTVPLGEPGAAKTAVRKRLAAAKMGLSPSVRLIRQRVKVIQ